MPAKMPRVDLTLAAQSDLKEIWDHVAQDSEFQADRLLNRFSLKFHYLALTMAWAVPALSLPWVAAATRLANTAFTTAKWKTAFYCFACCIPLAISGK